MTTLGHGEGPCPSDIAIVGEAYGRDEDRARRPFVGMAGYECNRLLRNAGINRQHCFITNVINAKPPDTGKKANDIDQWFASRREHDTIHIHGRHARPIVVQGIQQLVAELEHVAPRMIIAFGNTALWALTGKTGIKRWRGSMLYADKVFGETMVMPTYHPAATMRQRNLRAVVGHDLGRAMDGLADATLWEPPEFNFLVRPTWEQVDTVISWLWTALHQQPIRIGVDLEFVAGHISCIGLAFSDREAICIPFVRASGESYWTTQQEATIIVALRHCLTHPNAQCVGQYFIYDNQMFARHWGWLPNIVDDTAVAQSVIYPDGKGGERPAGKTRTSAKGKEPTMRKGLDFLSSMYCRWHVYWKDELKEYNRIPLDEEQYWRYNCRDAVTTVECMNAEDGLIDMYGLREQYDFQMRKLWPACVKRTLRGIRINHRAKEQAGRMIDQRLGEIVNELESVNPSVNDRPWYDDAKKTIVVMYDVLGAKAITNQQGRRTCDQKALERIADRDSGTVAGATAQRMLAKRKLDGMRNNLVGAWLDPDGDRIRSTIDPAGTETFRMSSGLTVFDTGTNLQNLITERTAQKSIDAVGDPDIALAAEVRKMLIPDDGCLMADVDLVKADLHVVVWEADDAELKQQLAEGVDVYSEAGAVVKMTNYDLCKRFIHLTNYGGHPRTASSACGITIHEAETAQRRWMTAHPGIGQWHNRTAAAAQQNPARIWNKLGYHKIFFGDSNDAMLREMLAWLPQSTVACVTNRAWMTIESTLPWVEVLLQGHDSLLMQFPTQMWPYRQMIQQRMSVTVPYDDPLTIPCEIKVSDRSWGDCQAVAWQ